MTDQTRPVRRRLAAVAALACAALLFALDLAAAPQIGQPAPDFSVRDTTGKTWDPAALKGKNVILEWTNDGCPYVQKHYESSNMQALQRDATAAGFVWLSVISSAPGKQGNVSAAQADTLTKERKAAPTAVILDPSGTIGRAFAAKTTPHMFVIDKTGTLVYMGAIDDRPSSDPGDIPGSKNYIRQAMADLAAERAVAESVTRPYGCSVKY
jgi:peroxiredoxin